jgi:hypothetical protein
MAVAAVTQQPIPVTEVFIGRVQLTTGSATVAFKRITQDSLVFLTGNDAAATGAMRAVITAGTGFVITSLVGAGDTGYVAYMIVIPPPES